MKSCIVTTIGLSVWFTVHPLAGQATDGFDFSGLKIFWETVDVLQAENIPTDDQWARLFDHPGYAQIERSGQRGRILRDVMPLVFMPSNAVALDSMLKGTDDGLRSRLHRRVGVHLVRARDMRAELTAAADTLRGSSVIDAAYERALAYLPSEQLRDATRPTVYVLLFEPNGFGGGSVAIDLLHTIERDQNALLGFIGHELHHAYLGRLDRTPNLDLDHPHAGILNSLSALFFEGTASLIDKPRYLNPTSRAAIQGDEGEYANLFAEWYAETPTMLQHIDSVLSGVATGSLDPATTGRTLRQELPSGGHPNGMYMAAAIEETFGRENLVLINDAFTFLLRYDDAAASSDGHRFSAETRSFVEGLRREYIN